MAWRHDSVAAVTARGNDVMAARRPIDLASWGKNGDIVQRPWVSGLSYKLHPNMVLNIDYRHFSAVKGQHPQEVNFGISLAF